jgi:signal transduction histidine kinase
MTVKRCAKIGVEKTRNLSHGLIPLHINDLGLTGSLKMLADDFAQHSHIRMSFNMANIDKLFSTLAEIAIYRIFQEIFTNIGKYAQASHVKIEVKKQHDNVSFQIEDDGKGFNIKMIELKRPTERGLGLASMDERIRMLNGCFEIQSQLNEGTKTKFTIPFKRAAIMS